jgi:hypothetical protein
VGENRLHNERIVSESRVYRYFLQIYNERERDREKEIKRSTCVCNERTERQREGDFD